MKKYRLTYFLLSTVFLASAQTPDPFTPDFSAPQIVVGMSLVWNDEFNADGKPNPLNWKYETGFVRNQELQYYQSDNVNCLGGVCVFDGKRETVVNTKYVKGSTDWRYKDSLAYWTSGSVKSQTLKSFQYGRFDVRARIDTTKGSWPAIWTKGNVGSWPACGEIDIMEFYISGGVPTLLANVIYGVSPSPIYYRGGTKPLSYFLAKDPDWCRKFHIWTETWTSDSINLYLDGERIYARLVSSSANPTGTTPANGFLQPHYFTLNLAIGANGGTPRASTTKYNYEVDYVRVYHNIPSAIETETVQPFRISPNRVSELLTIVGEGEISSAGIVNALGAKVLVSKNPSKQISVSHLPSGIYFAVINTVEGRSSVIRFLKN